MNREGITLIAHESCETGGRMGRHPHGSPGRRPRPSCDKRPGSREIRARMTRVSRENQTDSCVDGHGSRPGCGPRRTPIIGMAAALGETRCRVPPGCAYILAQGRAQGEREVHLSSGLACASRAGVLEHGWRQVGRPIANAGRLAVGMVKVPRSAASAPPPLPW
jgi:hypothetical protein